MDDTLKPLRPPATPLIVHDPYFSIWSFHDHLNGDVTRHWTGTPHPLVAWVKIDGDVYRLVGGPTHDLPALKQRSVDLWPTQTIYSFEDAGIELILRFTTPMLPDDLDLLSRPVSYVTWSVRSVDGAVHAVELYFEAASDLAVNSRDQFVIGSRLALDGLSVLRIGSYEQPVLKKAGDNLRIDWGYFYLATPFVDEVAAVIHARSATRDEYINRGLLPKSDDLNQPRQVRNDTLVAAMLFDLGVVTERLVTQYAVLAYDDLFSIEYFHRKLRPYWRREGKHMGDLLRDAVAQYPTLIERCDAFDRELMADLRKVGGEKYARVAALAFRQSLAAHKLAADIDGTPLLFSKENFSNGCIATVDVTYPTSPLFLVFNRELLKAAIRPVLEYAGLDQWVFPFAPHDLGTYPLANGQVYGGGETSEENQMPVEECGNMLIMAAAVCLFDGSTDFVLPYTDVLAQWASYLEQWGFDPANQLCTDDFAGHLAHNANLSLKAIVALGAYAALCQMLGLEKDAEHYRAVAGDFARQWVDAADDGDHYRLAFDKPGSWSQKYNLVWDKLLDLGLFPPEVAEKEIAFYKTKLNAYGLPLDNRQDWTKSDWIVWSATLSHSAEDFRLLIYGLYRFIDESPSRVPFSDWYWTTDGKQRGFQARPVVGGVFIKLLANEAMGKKYIRINEDVVKIE